MPIILGQVCQMLMGTVDSLMIGHVGTVPLAAAAFGGSVFGFFYLSGLGLCMPMAVFVSKSHGAGEHAECGEWLRHGLTVALLAGIVSALAMEIVGTQLHRLGQPQEVVAAAQPFFSLIALSLVPALAFQALRQFAESLGRPWLPMWVMLAGVVLNVILNWILIYGHCGFPALGLAGAGAATLVARCFDLTALAWIVGRQATFRKNWPVSWWQRLDASRVREMLRVGVPASGQLICEVGAFTAAAWMMGRIGTTALAAHQIALTCASMTFMFPLGISMASGMRVSHAMGAGEAGKVRAIGFGAYGMVWCAMGLFAVVFLAGGTAIARQYVSDAPVVALAAKLLAVAAFFQIFDGSQVVGAGLLRGLQDMRVPTLITAVAYWAVVLPLAYFWGVENANPVAVWRALAAGLAGAAILLASRFVWKTSRRT
jgi:MATE family multidrug resistance protein